jgi:hypothetical protein
MIGLMDHEADETSKENDMNKFLIAIATLVFAVGAMLTPTAPAQAGWKGRLAVGLAIGAIGAMSQHHRYEKRKRWKKKRYQAQRKAKKKVYTSKKSSSSTKTVAKAEPAPTPELPEKKAVAALVDNENSSISTTAIVPVEETASIDSGEPTAEPAKVVAEVPETAPAAGQKAANQLDCKKFFPSVGMTLSVSCD